MNVVVFIPGFDVRPSEKNVRFVTNPSFKRKDWLASWIFYEMPSGKLFM